MHVQRTHHMASGQLQHSCGHVLVPAAPSLHLFELCCHILLLLHDIAPVNLSALCLTSALLLSLLSEHVLLSWRCLPPQSKCKGSIMVEHSRLMSTVCNSYLVS